MLSNYNYLSLLFLLTLLTLTSLEETQASNMRFFNGNWEQAKKAALQQNKAIFVDVTASWCRACKMMEKDEFPLVADFYNQHFINYKMDHDTEEGTKFRNKYGIDGIPQVLYFGSQGNLLYRKDGLQTSEELMLNAERVLVRTGAQAKATPKKRQQPRQKTAQKPQYQQQPQYRPQPQRQPQRKPSKSPSGGTFVEHKYQQPAPNKRQKTAPNTAYNPSRTPSGIAHSYNPQLDKIIELRNLNMPYEKELKKYLAGQKLKGQLNSAENMDLIYDFSDDINSKAMDLLINKKSRFVEAYGEDHMNNKIKKTLLSKLAEATANKNEELFNRALWVVKAYGLKDAYNFNYNLKKNYYSGVGDKKNLSKTIIQFMNRYDKNDAVTYHLSATELVKADQSKSNLKTARSWVETSIAINSQYYNNETYGLILMMLGKKRLARQAFKEAIRLGQQSGRDISAAQKYLRTL